MVCPQFCVRVHKLRVWGYNVLYKAVGNVWGCRNCFGDVGIPLGRWSLLCDKAKSQQGFGFGGNRNPSALERRAESGINPAESAESRCQSFPDLFIFVTVCSLQWVSPGAGGSRFIPRLSSCLGCDTQMTRLAGPDLGWRGLIAGVRGGFGVSEPNWGW